MEDMLVIINVKTEMMSKRFLSIFLLLFCFIDINAQKLTVDRFEVKSNDITARTHPRQDINGVDCALIKVQLAAPHANFDGNLIGDVSYDTSIYMVYMSQGSKRLAIRLEGYLPLEVNFEDYEIKSLEAKTVYVLTISGISATNPIEPARTKTGWIILNSEPSGATVYINDEFVGNTPLTNYKQAYGTYNYRIEHPNYHPSTGTIELNSGKTEKTITLKPAFGAIAITSNVTGAKVLLDGKATNKTPCTLEEIPSGRHTIIVQKDKYSPRQQNVVVEDGQTAKISLTLDARFAQISINSLDGAQIYCNGELKGSTKYMGDLMEGYYDVEARLAHHKSVTKQIQVFAGQSQEISLSPTPIYGSLDVTSTPHDADVSIDGKSYGKTPLTIERLLEGEHKVVISKSQYASDTRTIIINENVNASINVALKNKESADMTTDKAIKTSPQSQEQFGIRTFTVGNVQFKMILVQDGTFKMGSESIPGRYHADDDEKPIHSVTLTNYYIGETEVSQALWQAVMGSNPSYFKDSNHPVEQVSWNDCQDFIKKLNAITGEHFRLPTEAEWEYAARGGRKSRGYMFAGSDNEKFVAWYTKNSHDILRSSPDFGTHNVRTKIPNELGLYNMSGNVGEWCSDWYDKYSSSAQTNPKGPTSGLRRVYRGGSWCDDSWECHVSSRRFEIPTTSSRHYIGLRLAL